MSDEVKTANQNRAQKAKALHEKNTKKRAQDLAAMKGLYLNAKDDPVLQDILAKANGMMKYHHKIAQDGVGARRTGHKLVDGSDEIENYFFSNNEIAGEMKKASGIQEIIDYIERMITLPEPKKETKKVS